MDHFEYKEAIEEAVAYHLSAMPKEVKEAISRANTDLYSGPSYYDKEGNEMSCFDEGAIPFDFSAACKIISEYTDTVESIKETIYGVDEDGEEFEYDEIAIDSSDVVKAIVGKELFSYI